jgi:hypothetical protein
MKVIELGTSANFGNLALKNVRSNNKFGEIAYLEEALKLVTTQYVTGYHIWKSDSGKLFLCLRNETHVADALGKITQHLGNQYGLTFKPPRDDGNLYLKLNPDLEAGLPKDNKLLLAIDVFGIFIQPATKMAYLQSQITGYRAYPIVDFDNIKVVTNDVRQEPPAIVNYEPNVTEFKW